MLSIPLEIFMTNIVAFLVPIDLQVTNRERSVRPFERSKTNDARAEAANGNRVVSRRGNLNTEPSILGDWRAAAVSERFRVPRPEDRREP